MKFWLSVSAALMLSCTAHAEDYRVVYSPSLELEVFIDDVNGSDPADWCKNPLPLRIVTSGKQTSGVLTSFLPRVGTLLANQCSKLEELPWQLSNASGAVLATGTAAREQNWRPVVLADGTAAATAGNATPLDLSQPASSAPLQHFNLPGGCHFRTWWDEHGQSLFIPDDKAMTCSTEGWLEGATRLTLNRDGQNQPVDVQFYQGYPLLNLQAPAKNSLEVTHANNQRMLLSRKTAPDSWLLLPFNSNLHVWSFNGTVLVKMTRQQAADADALKQRLDALRQAWSDVIPPRARMTVLLVNEIHTDLSDPAIGAWRTVN